MKRIILIVLMSLLLSACIGPVDQKPREIVAPTTNTRIVIVSISRFMDSRGMNRDILVLKDSATGIEYLAVMGAGVSEMLVPCGKNCWTMQDE